MNSTPDPTSAAASRRPEAQQSTFADLRELYRYVSYGRRRELSLLGGFILVGALAELASVAALFYFLGTVTASGATKMGAAGRLAGELAKLLHLSQVEAASALLMAVILCATGARLSLNWRIQRFVSGLGHELTLAVQSHILMQPYSYFASQSANPTITALEHVEVVVYQIILPLLTATAAGILAGFLVAAVSLVSLKIALAALISLGVFYAIITVRFTPTLTRISNRTSEAYTRRIMIASESVGGIRDVIINRAQPIFLEELSKADAVFSYSRATTAFVAGAPRFVVEGLGFALIAVVTLVISRDGAWTTALPTLGALALAFQRLLPLVQQMFASVAATAGHRAFLHDTLTWLRLPPPKHKAGGRDPPLEFNEHIVLEGVCFRYPGRTVGAIEDITVRIDKGSRVAITGATGSGKSTFADLLMGLIEPTGGRISVDGISLTHDNHVRWWKNLAHVPQAIFLADTTIAENIIFGAPSGPESRGRVVDAAKRAHLDEFIASLPHGYDTRVGERGIRLSGGERQRLGIARAIYKGAQVLVLDEPTSALDSETERHVMAAIGELSANMTVVMVAHRLSTLAVCDRVIQLEGGKVASIEERRKD
jgi:ABC-type bacteriocin/lantibiotic exporter with double-glycine peptidase domain